VSAPWALFLCLDAAAINSTRAIKRAHVKRIAVTIDELIMLDKSKELGRSEQAVA
jgi:hypothetical protein